MEMLESGEKLYGCCKCYKKFKFTELSTGSQLCKGCILEDCKSSRYYKQCEYCKSDFKQSVSGKRCPKCKSLEDKHGAPKSCSVCKLNMAFNSSTCIRCTHYRSRFGEPVSCQSCKEKSAFVKDDTGRSKVGGQVLCWVCTYNYKLAKSRTSKSSRTSAGGGGTGNKRGVSSGGGTTSGGGGGSLAPGGFESLLDPNSQENSLGAFPKRNRVDDFQNSPKLPAYSLDTMYNEHLLTIGQLQEEIKALRKQLSVKETVVLSKDRVIAELRSDILHMEDDHRERVTKLQRQLDNDRESMQNRVADLQRENSTLSKSVRKKAIRNSQKPTSQPPSRSSSP